MPDIAQILHDNGFKYHSRNGIFYVVNDLEIVHCEPSVKYIDVSTSFTIYINFYDRDPQVTNFGLNFDVDGYLDDGNDYIMKKFSNEDDFINELHRLNTIGSNIKG